MITIRLTAEQWAAVLAALADGGFRAPLIAEIKRQIKERPRDA